MARYLLAESCRGVECPIAGFARTRSINDLPGEENPTGRNPCSIQRFVLGSRGAVYARRAVVRVSSGRLGVPEPPIFGGHSDAALKIEAPSDLD